MNGVANEDIDSNGCIKPSARSTLVPDAVFVPMKDSEDSCDKCLFRGNSDKQQIMCRNHACGNGVWMTLIEAAMHKLENA